MTALKIFLLIIAAIVLFIVLIIYSLSPTIKNVSSKQALQPFVNTKLTLKRAGFIQKFEQGQYRFRSNVLTETIQYPDAEKVELPVGSVIIFKEFKIYRNNLGSGFTNLFGLGETIGPNKERIEFEYSWGSIDRDIELSTSKDLPVSAPIWQERDNR